MVKLVDTQPRGGSSASCDGSTPSDGTTQFNLTSMLDVVVQSAYFFIQYTMNLLDKKVLKGIGLMLLGMSTVPFLDIFAKLLSEDYSVMQVTWTRFFFHACWLIPIVLWQKLDWKRVPENPRLQFMRGLMLTLATLSFFAAIKSNPIPVSYTHLTLPTKRIV